MNLIEKMQNLPHSPVGRMVIQNLLFPAMVGVGFVETINGARTLTLELDGWPNWVRFLFIVCLVVYFCLSYVVNERLLQKLRYTLAHFWLDFFEVVLGLLCFSFLEGADQNSFKSQWFSVYVILSIVPILHILWNIAAKYKPLLLLSLPRIGFFLALVIWCEKSDSTKTHSVVALFSFSFLTLLHYKLVKKMYKEKEEKESQSK